MPCSLPSVEHGDLPVFLKSEQARHSDNCDHPNDAPIFSPYSHFPPPSAYAEGVPRSAVKGPREHSRNSFAAEFTSAKPRATKNAADQSVRAGMKPC